MTLSPIAASDISEDTPCDFDAGSAAHVTSRMVPQDAACNGGGNGISAGARSPDARLADSERCRICDERVKLLEKEKQDLTQRLEFVEELVGPTEAQRKALQEQSLAARAAALRAKHNGANIPTRVTGRLDEQMLWYYGLSERDAGLLQGGCLPDDDGILQDVSLLGDPGFQPYHRETGEAQWNARGGLLKLSLGEVLGKFGEAIAQDVVRCAKELDEHDGSRRIGSELPWHPIEDRELQASEVIELMGRELSIQAKLRHLGSKREAPMSDHHNADSHVSPYASGTRRRRRGRVQALRASGAALPGAPLARPAPTSCASPVAAQLPRIDGATQGRRLLVCAGAPRRGSADASLDRALMSCGDRERFF